MEHLHMNRLRDLIHRLRAGESERRIARDMSLSRTTVRNLRSGTGRAIGYLRPEQGLPDDATLFATLGSGPRPPQVPSTVEPYQEVVQRLLDQGVEMTAVFQRLRDDHGYAGSYWAKPTAAWGCTMAP